MMISNSKINTIKEEIEFFQKYENFSIDDWVKFVYLYNIESIPFDLMVKLINRFYKHINWHYFSNNTHLTIDLIREFKDDFAYHHEIFTNRKTTFTSEHVSSIFKSRFRPEKELEEILNIFDFLFTDQSCGLLCLQEAWKSLTSTQKLSEKFILKHEAEIKQFKLKMNLINNIHADVPFGWLIIPKKSKKAII